MKGIKKEDLMILLNNTYPDNNYIVFDDTIYDIFINLGDDYIFNENHELVLSRVNMKRPIRIANIIGEKPHVIANVRRNI